MGKYLLLAGLVLAAIGGLLWLAGDKVRFLGKLPGDIYIKRENFTFFFPISTMILLSVVLSCLLWIIRRLKG